MPESNLFEIFPVDEFNTMVVEATDYLESLPAEEQIAKVKHYLTDLEGEYEKVADATERARVSKLMGAARNHLKRLRG